MFFRQVLWHVAHDVMQQRMLQVDCRVQVRALSHLLVGNSVMVVQRRVEHDSQACSHAIKKNKTIFCVISDALLSVLWPVCDGASPSELLMRVYVSTRECDERYEPLCTSQKNI